MIFAGGYGFTRHLKLIDLLTGLLIYCSKLAYLTIRGVPELVQGESGKWGVGRADWRLEKGMEGKRMEKNGLSPPVAAASFWFSSSITKPLLTRDQITAVSGQLSHLCSCRRKASEASMASSLLQATMVGTQRELQERRQPGRKQRQHCYQDPATAIGVIGWYWLPQQGVQILMNTL